MAKLNPKKIKILVFGTFDILHAGHINFFRQARRLHKNPYLIVSLARDVNVKRIKGARPLNSEKERLVNVASHALVNEAVLGASKNYLKHIAEINPSIIALGYDQSEYTQNLAGNLAKLGLKVKIIRLKSYLPRRYKTSLIRNKPAVDI